MDIDLFSLEITSYIVLIDVICYEALLFKYLTISGFILQIDSVAIEFPK